MSIKLNDCKLITNSEYAELESPEFVGQSLMNEKCEYYMVWRSNGLLYKTFNTL